MILPNQAPPVERTRENYPRQRAPGFTKQNTTVACDGVLRTQVTMRARATARTPDSRPVARVF